MSLSSLIKFRYTPQTRPEIVTCHLSAADRRRTSELLRSGVEAVRVTKRARALELLDEGLTAPMVAAAVGLSPAAVRNYAHRYVRSGLERALYEAPRPGGQFALTEKQEARIVAMVCSKPPDGFERWSLSLIRKEATSRGITQSEL